MVSLSGDFDRKPKPWMSTGKYLELQISWSFYLSGSMVLTLLDDEDEDEDGTGLGSQNKVLKSEVSKHKQQLERLQQKVI